jgi:hypothetical protein
MPTFMEGVWVFMDGIWGDGRGFFYLSSPLPPPHHQALRFSAKLLIFQRVSAVIEWIA